MTYPITPNPAIHANPTSTGQSAQSQQVRQQLQSMFAGLPAEIIELIVNAILGAFGLGAISGPIDELISGLVNAITHIPQEAVAGLTGALNGFVSWIDNFKIFIGGVPVGAITSQAPNLLEQPTFASGSILINPWWTVNPSNSRTSDGSGCAQVIADGTYHALRSGSTPVDRIAVSPGQTFSETIYLSHANLVTSGSNAPVQLQAVPYSGINEWTPAVLATYTPATATLAWPGYELTGSFTIPAGVTDVQTRIVVTDAAQSGTLYFDDANSSQTGQIQQSWISGLPTALQGIAAQIQVLIDTIFNAITGGGNTVGNTLENLADALLAIPASSIAGILGPLNIGDTITNLVNQLVGGFVGVLGGGASLADLFNIGQQVSSGASQGTSSWQVLGIRDNTSMSSGFLPSGIANFNLTDVAFSSSAPTIAATQAASAICTTRIPQSTPIGIISWLGYGTTNITEFYINLWLIDSTGWSLSHHSPNIIDDLSGASGTSPVFLFYTLATPLDTTATQQYAVEFVPVGGTHNMVGQTTGSWLPAHPTAPVSKYGYTRNNTSSPDSPPATIATASLVGADTVPWAELAVNDGGATADTYQPLQLYFTENGSVPVPSWCNYIDAVALGAGGGGHQGGTLGVDGQGGMPGKFNAITWERGTDFSGSDIVVTFTDGVGGAGGGLLEGHAEGSAGTATTLQLDPSHVVTAEGGAGGSSLFIISGQLGQGPAPYTYNGINCVAGGNQNSYGGAGASPGGGGAGGNWLTFSAGGTGAPGAGWVQFRQAPLSGEAQGVPGSPTAPAVTFTKSTFSTITVAATENFSQTVTLTAITSTEAFGVMTV